MKQLLLLILFCYLSTPTKAGDLSDPIFPTSDAIWTVRFAEGMMGQIDNYYYAIYGMSGDTLIDNTVYSKLYLLNDTTLNIDKEDVFVAGIRVQDKQVWLKPATKKDGTLRNEYLLYDFSLKKDDVLTVDNFPYFDYRKFAPTFEDVNTFLSDGFKIESSDESEMVLYSIPNTWRSDAWYPLIGSRSGLFFYDLEHVFDLKAVVPSLQCMKYKGEVRYLSGCKSCFEKHDYNNIKANTLNTAKIYYDLELKRMVVTSDIPCQLYLYDLNGNIRQTIGITTTNTDVDVNSLPKGIYIYKLDGSNLNQRGKLIIQ